MEYFEDKLKIYNKHLEDIYSENYKESDSLSLRDIGVIDDLLSLATMHKNGIIGNKLKMDFQSKLENLHTKLTVEELKDLLIKF